MAPVATDGPGRRHCRIIGEPPGLRCDLPVFAVKGNGSAWPDREVNDRRCQSLEIAKGADVCRARIVSVGADACQFFVQVNRGSKSVIVLS